MLIYEVTVDTYQSIKDSNATRRIATSLSGALNKTKEVMSKDSN